MNKILSAFLVISTLSFVGCTSTGNQQIKNETNVTLDKKIIRNQTTKSEIKKLFGSPTNVRSSNGKEIWQYDFQLISKSAVNYIPGIKLLGTSSTETNKVMIINFDGNIVVDYSMDETKNSSKTGIYS